MARRVRYYCFGVFHTLERRRQVQQRLMVKDIIDKEFHRKKHEVSLPNVKLLIMLCNDVYDNGVCGMRYITEYYYDQKHEVKKFVINHEFLQLVMIFSMVVVNEEISNKSSERRCKYLIIRYFGNDFLEIAENKELRIQAGISKSLFDEKFGYLMSLLFDKVFVKQLREKIADIREKFRKDLVFRNSAFEA